MKNWDKLSDDELLKLRIKDLELDLNTSDLAARIGFVFDELETKGLKFRPLVYLGDEWFSPEGVSAVSIPFFLSHPRLRALEKKIMFDIEGETAREFSLFLRHEIGHSFDHAFKVSRRKKWREIFGSPHKEYHPETYRPRPYSRNYVLNLPRWYAQAHPDEDFAETFAVWLDPNSNWQTVYKSWGAIKKLEYIDELAKEFSNAEIAKPRGRMMSDAKYLESTLKHYYDRKKKSLEEDYPDFFDRDLLRIFSVKSSENIKSEKAVSFMKRNRKQILKAISHWTGERKFTVEEVLSRLTKRCKELNLVLVGEEHNALIELSAFVSSLVANYLFTGHFKRTI